MEKDKNNRSSNNKQNFGEGIVYLKQLHEKDIPAKPDKNPDPTAPKPGGNEPEKNDPTRVDEPPQTDPTRINEPPQTDPTRRDDPPQPEPAPAGNKEFTF